MNDATGIRLEWIVNDGISRSLVSVLINVCLCRHGCKAGSSSWVRDPTGKGGHSECIPDAPYSPRQLVTPGNALKGQCVSGHGSPIWASVSPSLVPRPRMKRESGLVSTVCNCTNDSGNLLRTSPIMDKLRMVVMRRNTQTRYTACSVAAVFMW